MKLLPLAMLAAGILSGWTVRAQSPEDRYVQVYSLIEAADRLRDSGEARPALAKYLEAQVALKGLQQSSPEWNSKLIAYRLDYIASQLGPLTRKPAARGAPGTPLEPPTAGTSQLKQLEEDIAQLSRQNAFLEAKLREALTVHPAAVDPRELAKADERIKQLQKERDLLAVALEQSKPQPGGDPAADRRQSVATQSAVANLLQKQNEELQKQVAALATRLKASARDQAPGDASSSLRETIAALEASNRVMKEEQAAMEARLKEFVRQHGPASAQRQAELEQQLVEARAAAETARKERDAMIEKLNTVSRELNQRDIKSPAAATHDLERQLEAIRAKLQSFEARNISYTPEELALFKRAPLKVAPDRTAAANNTVATADPGKAAAAASTSPTPETSTRFAEALRDIDAGRLAEAEQKFRALLSQDQNNTTLLNRLAAAQMDQDKGTDAEANLRRTLQLEPQNPVALYLLGGLRLREERYDDAIESLSLSAKLDPDRANTQYLLAQALIQKGSRGPAETALRRALQLKPGWGDAHYLLSVLYATGEPGFRELAQYHYKQAIQGGAARNYDLEKAFEQPPRKP